MTQIRAISFDLDDTLWPVAPVIETAEQAVHAWFLRHGPPVARCFDVEGLRRLRLAVAEAHPEQAHDLSLMRRLSLRLACRQAGVDEDLAEPAFQIFFEARNRVQWYEDVAEVISSLAERHTLVALSNGNADLALTGLAPWFRFGISAIEAGAAKPDPRMFHHAARRLDLAPAEILHVGDDPLRDVAGARRAGCAAVLLDRIGDRGVDSPVPVIRNLRALPALIEDGTATRSA
ncbi:putative hydrolase of the HAD superfamily [Natronospira proteinivora]|uniref:Hydrolase of the HAD superfamily n=1 Tax=Natronospira proteinivora TaxID=1807133 RepID=A0ABT1G9J4_9GAMM|nr:HAD-IA family hydrolase [Natronospira proteinivora]MCP1727994.1 putative hydrolase of the HAD superfamily [Natronospira proteinivora]